MANKNQAKAAVSAAATYFNNDIDVTLPVGVNIQDGRLDFAPTRGYIKMLAPDETTAETWKNTIVANLVTEGRQHTVRKEGAYAEDIHGSAAENVITIVGPPVTYQIYF